MNKIIKFYSVNDEYGEFSNFAKYPIKVGKKVWPTSEHYFQAMKFDSSRDQEDIRKSKSPMEAAKKDVPGIILKNPAVRALPNCRSLPVSLTA